MKRSAIAPFGLRIPPELRSKLEAAATDADRSLTAEILHRLQWSFVAAVGDTDSEERLTMLEQRMGEVDEITRRLNKAFGLAEKE